MFVRHLLLLLFSFCVHGTAAGALFFFTGQKAVSEEPVYRVVLAELASQETPVAPSVEQPSPPPPEPQPPEPVPPVSAPAPKIAGQPKSKKISVRKKNNALAVEKQQPDPAKQPHATVSRQEQMVPRPQQVGALSAYKVDHVDQQPSIARRVEPKYPVKAKRMEIEGKVMVQLVVDKEGQPQVCSILSAVPAGYFEDAALVAAAKMRFIPGKIQGQPVNTMIVLPFTFRLQ